jgi:Cdc6-like AAA superfamily ATPase
VPSEVENTIKRWNDRLDDEYRQEIINWLPGVDYTTQQHDFISKRQEGTMQWLLESVEFQHWRKESRKTLFCPGIPGAGKTVATATVIDYLCGNSGIDVNIGVAYVYCNFRRHQDQNLTDILSSILKQLVQRQQTIPENVNKLFSHHKPKQTRPTWKEISSALQSVIPEYSRAFIIIDALDEFQISSSAYTSETNRQTFLAELLKIQENTHANIFATSRPNEEITLKFKDCLSLEIRATSNDVHRYVDSHLHLLPSFVRERAELQTEIIVKITAAVDGM